MGDRIFVEEMIEDGNLANLYRSGGGQLEPNARGYGWHTTAK